MTAGRLAGGMSGDEGGSEAAGDDRGSEAAADGGDPASPPRPGPDALYGPNPTPPQLENGAGWEAEPLLVSGCDAYRDGEYLYQDYVYDDHGADTRTWTSGTPTDAATLGGILSQPTGDYCYPNDPDRYGYNAADLLEFRARPTADGVAYRVTLNTMLDPDAAVVAIGIDRRDDGAAARTDWGYGLGELGAPVDHRIMTWGRGAELDGDRLPDDRFGVDVRRNQLEVEVPLDPGAETWRHYLVVGLWDDDRHGFAEVARNPDAETPGGARTGGDEPPVFNVGFRFDEPSRRNLGLLDVGRGVFDVLDVTGIGHGLVDLVLDRSPRVLGEGNWREHGQARALAERDISAFHADVDFAALRAGVDERNVPGTGFRSLLYPSRYYLGEGIDTDNDVLQGRIQPYNVYVPAELEEPAPLVVLLHSLSCAYTQYAVYMPSLVRQISEETGAVVLMPQARGPGRWYKREAELDVFEAWRDLETRFEIDRSRVTVGGYSMGGFGTYMLAAQCPDLFARGFSIVGPPSEDPIEGLTSGLLSAPPQLTGGLLGGEGGGDLLTLFSPGPESALDVASNLRHVPMLMWNGGGDPLVPLLSPENYARRLRNHGYRYQYDLFPVATHLSMGYRDRWDRIPEFLARGRVVRNPRRVTYRQVPALDHPEVGLVHDGAYWVSDVRTRPGERSGLVDAVSLADGYAPPETRTFRRYGRTPQRHLSRGLQWETPPVDARRNPGNALEVTLEGVRAATVWVAEAGLDVDRELTVRVESDGEATLTLATTSGTRELAVPAGESTEVVLLGDRSGGSGTVGVS